MRGRTNAFVRKLSTVAALAAGLSIPLASSARAVSPEWQKIEDAAREEGSVTIYSGHSLDQLNDLKRRFEEKYQDIKVLVVRGIDSELNPRVDVELESGQGIGDIFVTTDITRIKKIEAAGNILGIEGPSFANPAYDRAKRAPSDTWFEVSGTVATFGWNTDLWPQGMKDYDSAINPELKGKIGIPNAQGAFAIDYYFYLMQRFGDDFIDKLAELESLVYASSLPLEQAVASGEVAVSIYGKPLIKLKDSGAPVDWGLNDNPFGASFHGMILKSAPHPNAAQLLADFMVTEGGQKALANEVASVLPNIEGAIMSTGAVRQLDPSELTEEKMTAFQKRFEELFVKN